MRPSCGRRFSEMSSFARIFRRESDRVLELQGRIHDLVQDPVDPEADPELLLVRLDVDVRRPPFDGVGQDEVHELDDRRLFGRIDQRVEVHLLFFFEDLQVRALGLLKVFHDLLQFERGGRTVVVVDRPLDAQLGGHDRLDVVAGHELDVVHGEDVRRIGHGDRDRGSGLVDRQDVVLTGDVGGDHLDDAAVDLEVLEVDRGDAKLLGEALGDVLFRDKSELDEGLAELGARLLLNPQGFLELILRDQARFRQQFTETNAHSWNSGGRKWKRAAPSRSTW